MGADVGSVSTSANRALSSPNAVDGSSSFASTSATSSNYTKQFQIVGFLVNTGMAERLWINYTKNQASNQQSVTPQSRWACAPTSVNKGTVVVERSRRRFVVRIEFSYVFKL